MRLAVLLSGRGSNFQAIHEAVQSGRLTAEIACVISNRPDAAGIARARVYGYDTQILDHRAYATRSAHEEEVLRVLSEASPDLVVLAGYMRLLSARFVAAYANRIVNIHPSLLPSFPGIEAQGQALAYGVKVTGCTVHFVDEQLDAGPIIAQRTVPIQDGDSIQTLSARILEQEHQAYVEALQALSTRRWRVDGRRVVFG